MLSEDTHLSQWEHSNLDYWRMTLWPMQDKTLNACFNRLLCLFLLGESFLKSNHSDAVEIAPTDDQRFPRVQFFWVELFNKDRAQKLLLQALLSGEPKLNHTLWTKIENPNQTTEQNLSTVTNSCWIFFKHWNEQTLFSTALRWTQVLLIQQNIVE